MSADVGGGRRRSPQERDRAEKGEDADRAADPEEADGVVPRPWVGGGDEATDPGDADGGDGASDRDAHAAAEDERGERRGRPVLWLVLSLVVLAIGGGIFAFLTFAGEEPSPPARAAELVRAAEVQPARTLMLSQTGFVRPRAEVEVAPEVAGRIERVGDGFVLGGRVERGDLLIQLEQERFEADVARARAAVQRAEAALAQAEVDRGRQEELEARDFASEAALQQAIVAVAAAEGDLTAARADLTQAEIALADTVVLAPFDALVTAEAAAVGQLVPSGQSVGTLVAADAVEVLMGLTPGDVDVLGDPSRAVGGRVLVRATDTTTEASAEAQGVLLAQGLVTEIDPRIEEATRTIALVVTVADPFDGEGRRLRIGELVELGLPISLENRSAVEVPPEAVKGRDLVWLIEDGVLRRRRVEPLDRLEDRIVLRGVAVGPGDLVMVSDLPAPFDGKRVRVQEEEPAGAASPGGEGAEPSRADPDADAQRGRAREAEAAAAAPGPGG
ncbi:efflux RND transporter periplasmic adaptor subunit [Acuticoccus sp.]|uniref:efflux RND transporter periplasmic adaptor subunit n=1 Tax=Acuticoccus sp. TaxID=1904378 RepID=UPI003B518FC5